MSRIVFLALRTYSSVGGIQAFNRRVIRTLADRAQKGQGEAPVVVLNQDGERAVEGETGADFRPCGASRLRFVAESLAACRGAEVILIGHINLLPVAAICRLVAPKARQMLFAHGDEVWGDPTYRKTRWLDRLLLRRLDRIIPVSDFTARRMQRTFGLGPERFVRFQNAVDPLVGPPPTRTRSGILAVSRMDAHDHGKNLDQLIRAFGLLAGDRPDLRCTIIGDGVLRPDLERLAASLGLAGRVIFPGRVDEATLADAYAAASVFVLPSQKEGFGIVYLEAWQRGLPVICGDRDAAAGLVRDGEDGYVVDPHDLPAFAARLGHLLDHPQHASRLGEAGRRKVERDYLMPQFQQRLSAILFGGSNARP